LSGQKLVKSLIHIRLGSIGVSWRSILIGHSDFMFSRGWVASQARLLETTM
jgi:hypothetical protein